MIRGIGNLFERSHKDVSVMYVNRRGEAGTHIAIEMINCHELPLPCSGIVYLYVGHPFLIRLFAANQTYFSVVKDDIAVNAFETARTQGLFLFPKIVLGMVAPESTVHQEEVGGVLIRAIGIDAVVLLSLIHI